MSTAVAHRIVDLAHAEAAARLDPTGFMRAKQAEAERRFVVFGSAHDLAVVRAYESSLDGAR